MIEKLKPLKIMISENVKLAVQNFVLWYYKRPDVIEAYEVAGDFLEGEEELSQFDEELIRYLNSESEIVVEGYNGIGFFPIHLGIDSDLKHLTEYLREKI
jgi:hypothetical protein